MKKNCFIAGNPYQEFTWNYKSEQELFKEYIEEIKKIARFLLIKGYNYFVFSDNENSSLDLMDAIFELQEEFSFQTEICVFHNKIENERILSFCKKAHVISDFSRIPSIFHFLKWKSYAKKNADLLFSVWNGKKNNQTFRVLRMFEKTNRNSIFFATDLLSPYYKEIEQKIRNSFGLSDIKPRNEWDL